MPHRRASRRWVGPSHCGGFRAAAADADVAVIGFEEGPDLVARLRQALVEAPQAKRFVFNLPPPSPIQGIPSSLRGQGGGGPVSVVGVPITDTCKEVVDGLVRRTVPRDSLVEARGPWMFDRVELLRALDVASTAEVTNLVGLCRVARLRVRVLIQP